MEFNPEDADQVELAVGEYEAVVTGAEEATSKKGDAMFKLTLAVYDENGKSHVMTCYLVNTKAALWRIKNFCSATGLDFSKGKLTAAQCKDHTVKVKIKHGTDNTGATRAEIATFSRLDRSAPEVQGAVSLPDDDVPF